MPKKSNKLWLKIKELKSKEHMDSLRWHVLNHILNAYSEDSVIERFFQVMSSQGCSCGWVGHLTLPSDAHKFFDKYYKEIQKLKNEQDKYFGIPPRVEGDIKTWFAWFGFQETTRRIENELGLKI